MAIKNQTHAWYYIFNSLGLYIYNYERINPENLIKPDSYIQKAILFIYSLETYLPYTMNKADRERDS